MQLSAAQKNGQRTEKRSLLFLSGANPHWPRKALEEMLQTHLDLTTGEVVGRLKAADIKAYA